MESNLKVTPDQMRLLKNRDITFLKQLFLEVNPYLFKVLATHKIFDDTAEELIHQTWQVFFEGLDRFEGRSQIRTFVTGILINKMREHRRFYKKMQSEEDSEKMFQKSFTQDGWWVNEPADPQALLNSAESLKFIEDCIESLSESQKNAFLLKEVDEEKTNDICNILSVSVTHLGVLLFRAKEKLRLCLQGKVQGESL